MECAVTAGVQPGSVVDDFELADETGVPRRLSDLLAGSPVVLFFYPAAFTPGCTAQSCHFRDLAAEFAAAGAHRVGISRDPVPRLKEFAERYRFDFPLLSDPDGTVAALFGVTRRLVPGPLRTRRITFVIDRDRRILEVIHNEANMAEHADRALRVLRERSEA
jgi:peroxiredoxin Q/BCP